MNPGAAGDPISCIVMIGRPLLCRSFLPIKRAGALHASVDEDVGDPLGEVGDFGAAGLCVDHAHGLTQQEK